MQPDTEIDEAADEAGTAPAPTIKEGRIRVVLPSGWIVEKSIPDRSREALAALRGKIQFADGYDYKALRKSRMWDDESSLPESCEVCPRRPGK